MSQQDGLLQRQRALIDAFADSLGAPSVQVFETHISCVLVAGEFAYKFKKAVRYDFVDFSTLQARRFYCEEEMRLNGRLAPDIYLGVVALRGSEEHPTTDGEGEALEYAVKMRAFDQQALWSHRLASQLLQPAEVDRLAESVAQFHRDTAVAGTGSAWCTPSALEAIADETLDTVATHVRQEDERRVASSLRAWEMVQRERLAATFEERRRGGAIRECHGDLHSGNILTLGDKVEAFDCIEFNDSLRWIDVMNDIAFACMDLRFLQREELAARLLNHYLEATGDYAGLAVLNYYEVHRALIRCKVALLRAAQENGEQARPSREQASAYLAFAYGRTQRRRPALLLMHGFSGCGKSTLAAHLVEALDAIRLRSDVERKRMHGMPAEQHAPEGSPLYAAAVTSDTYCRLAAIAAQVAAAGWTAIVDATCLKAAQRAQFSELAAELGVPFFIIDVRASEAAMRARILRRQQFEHDASDAGLEVLAQQLKHHDPLSAQEMARTIVVDSEESSYDDAVRDVARAVAPLAAGGGA